MSAEKWTRGLGPNLGARGHTARFTGWIIEAISAKQTAVFYVGWSDEQVHPSLCQFSGDNYRHEPGHWAQNNHLDEVRSLGSFHKGFRSWRKR